VKGYVKKVFDRLVRRSVAIVQEQQNDILWIAQKRATEETTDFYLEHCRTAKPFSDGISLLTHAASISKRDGLILEFGVATGRTITHLASCFPNNKIYGFDSFEGLPENWHGDFSRGTFQQPMPRVPCNVELIKGWFRDTLPNFVKENASVDIRLLHIDCDLYSSTKTVFDNIAPLLSTGSIIVFDEYWNYPGWQHHEHKAFRELVKEWSLPHSYEAFVSWHQQVCVRID
jgi:predicted O-methyltransferase YrrM